jgi:hypothetical protein
MLRLSTRRLLTALVAVLSLLFSQMALASYVCPGMGDTASMAQMMASGQPCEGMDPVQPVLCHQHGADAPQSFEAIKIPTPTLPMLVQVLVVPLALDATPAAAAPLGSTPEARPPPDPLFLATLRLRV